jgi:hypothetical protein
MQTLIRPCHLRSLTRLDKAATIGSSVGVGSSTEVPLYSRGQPMKDGRLEPGFMPPLKGGLHRKVEETSMRVSLKTYSADNLSIISARLVLREEIVFE